MGFLGIALAHTLADGIATIVAVLAMYIQYKILKINRPERQEKHYEKNPDTEKVRMIR